MEQQYGDDFISITDEDGKEYELEEVYQALMDLIYEDEEEPEA